MLLKYDGVYYLDGYCVSKLGDHWKIDSTANLAGISTSGLATVTMDEYIELTK